MDQEIEALLKNGKRKIEQDEQKRKKEMSVRIESLKNIVREIEAQWCEALPKGIRKFMGGISDEEIVNFLDCDISSQLTHRDIWINIPGFAPIQTSVEKDAGGAWIQIRNSRHGRLPNYLVPGVFEDSINGVYWNWRLGESETDDLEVALARAEKQYQKYEALRSSQRRKREKTEPSYENFEEAEMSYGFSEESFRDFVRIIVDEIRAE